MLEKGDNIKDDKLLKLKSYLKYKIIGGTADAPTHSFTINHKAKWIFGVTTVIKWKEKFLNI